jgi:hypothetical protein
VLSQQLQQTGMLFIIMQQVQPAFIMALQHSQQAWIIAAQSLSPLVQVRQTPCSVISHLHMPIIRLQQQTIRPFIMVQQLHMPPAIMVQRFWSIEADVASSLVQVIFMPPVHFSIFIVHRGTIIMFVPAGIAPGPPIIPVPMVGLAMPGIPIPARSISLVVISIAPVLQAEIRPSVRGRIRMTCTIGSSGLSCSRRGYCAVTKSPASSRFTQGRGGGKASRPVAPGGRFSISLGRASRPIRDQKEARDRSGKYNP